MDLERNITLPPTGEGLPAAIAANSVRLAGVVETSLGQLGWIYGPRRPGWPQQVRLPSDRRLIRVAAVQIQRPVAGVCRICPR